MFVINKSQGKLVAKKIRKAENLFQRIKGLLGTSYLGPDEGLWIPHCQGVHTFGMQYPIDVIYLNSEGQVVGLRSRLTPNEAGPIFLNAASVLELGEGTIERGAIKPGDVLKLEDIFQAVSNET